MIRAAPKPIVVSAPRSGTTLLRFMLDAHRDLAIPTESGFLVPCAELAARGTVSCEEVQPVPRSSLRRLAGGRSLRNRGVPRQPFSSRSPQLAAKPFIAARAPAEPCWRPSVYPPIGAAG